MADRTPAYFREFKDGLYRELGALKGDIADLGGKVDAVEARQAEANGRAARHEQRIGELEKDDRDEQAERRHRASLQTQARFVWASLAGSLGLILATLVVARVI